MNKELFKKLCSENGLMLSENQLQQLDTYFQLLVETNKVMNLTAIDDEEGVYEKHFYDSLLFSFSLELANKTLVDVGTGAGFPGLVIAICYPKCHVTLIEPLAKRCNFLQKVINALSLKNVEIINKRGEEIKELRNHFDYATARAVARLNILLEIIMPLLKEKGIFIALKGKQGEEEIDEAKNALKVLNSQIIKKQKTSLITEQDTRINIYVQLLKEVNQKYPRNYSQIKKRPL